MTSWSEGLGEATAVTRYDAGTTKAAVEQEDAFKTDLEVGLRVHVIGGVLISRNWVPRLAAEFTQTPGPRDTQFSDLHCSLEHPVTAWSHFGLVCYGWLCLCLPL